MFEDNKLIVTRWLEAVHGGKDAVWDSHRMMASTMTWTLIGTTPVSGTFRGLDEIRDLFQFKCWNGDGRPGSGPQGLDLNYGIRPLQIEEVVALEDGRVLVRCRSDGMGKNGLPYQNEYCWLFTVQDNKIVALYEFADTALIEKVMFDKRIVPAEALAASKVDVGITEPKR